MFGQLSAVTNIGLRPNYDVKYSYELGQKKN